MTHPRKVIRTAVRDALDGATAAGANVFASRVDPYRLQTLPAVGVYSLEESVDDESAETSPRELTRRLSLVVEGWVTVAGADPADDLLDDLTEEIEAAMDVDRYFGGNAAESILTDTTSERITVGDRDMAMAALVYRVTYRTDAPVTVPTLDDFETVKATHNLGNEVGPGDEAVDIFTVEEEP